jgi:hypothetical protein
MVIAWIPSVVASLLVTAFCRLERQQGSLFGRYLSATMTPAVTAQRMAGQIVMWYGAYMHEAVLLVLGPIVVVLAWLSGLGRATGATQA